MTSARSLPLNTMNATSDIMPVKKNSKNVQRVHSILKVDIDAQIAQFSKDMKEIQQC